MKRSKDEVHGKTRDALDVRFEAQHLTSFSGLNLFQRLFAKLGLKGGCGGAFATSGAARSTLTTWS